MRVRFTLLLGLATCLLDGCLTNSSSVQQSNLDRNDSEAVAEIYAANGNESLPRSMIFTNAQGRITALLPCIVVGDSQVCRKISRLTPAIGRLTELENLTLDEVPSQDSLPAELWSLPSLKQLSLRDCRLTALPESLGNLQNLEWLNITATSSNDTLRQALRTLPVSLGRLRKLKMLVVRSGGLEILPSSLGDLESLTYLAISGNRLDSLPSSIGKLKKLDQLDAGQNRLAALPTALGSLKSLKHMNLGINRLASLPASIGDIDSLRTLNLIGNLIVELPPELGRLRMLEMLALSFNPLQRIPDEVTSIQSLKPEYGGFLHSTKLCRASLNPQVLNWLDQFFPEWKQGTNCPTQ